MTLLLLPPGRRRYSHLTYAERELIRRLLSQKRTPSDIARMLGKHRATVLREIKRNTNEAGIYYEKHAHVRMLRRRKAAKHDSLILENDPPFQDMIERLLKNRLSPEQISGFLHHSGSHQTLCHKSIYSWAHRRWQSRKAYLRFKGRPRVPYGARKDMWQPNKRHISERPLVADKRRRVGDWEGDLVHGTKDDSRHALLTLNDRATGLCIVRKVRTLNAHSMAQIIALALRDLPVHTITFDNGFEFGQHKTIEKPLKCEVYFTDTHSPEQRGSNENLNGLLREFFPKGVSLAHVSQLDASLAAKNLNARPRKRLGYDSPRHVFSQMTGMSEYRIWVR